VGKAARDHVGVARGAASFECLLEQDPGRPVSAFHEQIAAGVRPDERCAADIVVAERELESLPI
jgi:hypothetical protein